MTSSSVGVDEALDVAGRYLIHMSICLPVLYLIYVHRNNLQAIDISRWSMISGIFEAVTRTVMAKVIFLCVGVEILFYIEPAAWIVGWLMVMVPFYSYQKTQLPV